MYFDVELGRPTRVLELSRYTLRNKYVQILKAVA